jgi:hypothetical protein
MFAIVVAISSAIAVVCRLVVVFRATRRTTTIGDKALEERLGFAVRTTEVLFGREVYARLRRKDHPFQRDVTDLWKSVPEEGVRHVISYVDTAPEDATKRTLLLLHGMPGGIIDWEPFVRHFGREYRLLVPQLPDFHFSRTSGHFWHSNEERAALVTAFAAALGVSRVLYTLNPRYREHKTLLYFYFFEWTSGSFGARIGLSFGRKSGRFGAHRRARARRRGSCDDNAAGLSVDLFGATPTGRPHVSHGFLALSPPSLPLPIHRLRHAFVRRSRDSRPEHNT